MSGSQKPGFPSGNLTLLANGQVMSGWQTIRVTRGMENVPSDFDIVLTDRYPTASNQMEIEAGMSCQVMIGGDLVLTGFIDVVILSVNAQQHQIRIIGRSKVEDLVDSSITSDEMQGYGIKVASLPELAAKLCTQAPYKIPVKNLSKRDLSLPVALGNQVQAVLTESPWNIMERISRGLGVLMYDDTDGAVIIADVGNSTMASGFQEGVNVQQVTLQTSMHDRFSVYIPSLLNFNLVDDKGAQSSQTYPGATDPGVGRYRPKVIVSETFQIGEGSFATTRAQWEASRRMGRSHVINIVCDSWRDTDGVLWQPNAFAPIDLPSVKVTDGPDQWIIASVTFARDISSGTTANLILMPKAAFQPEPIILAPIIPNPGTPGPDAAAQAEGNNVPGGAPT